MFSLGEYFVICFSIAKSCIGAGIYFYPKMFSMYGVYPTILATILSCVASMLGTYIYIDFNKKFKKGNTISTLGSLIVGKWFRYIVDVVVIFKCIAVGAGYLNKANTLTRDAMVKAEVKGIWANLGYFITGIGCILLTPSILSKQLGKLRYLSYIGTFSVFVIVLLSIFQAIRRDLNLEMFTSDRDLLKNIGTFVFGFTCHQSILTIHNETRTSENILKFMIFSSFVMVAILYIVFGHVNYSAFSYFKGKYNILEDPFVFWGVDTLSYKVATGLFVFMLIITVPFQIHPAKSYFIEMFNLSDKMGNISGLVMIAICYFLTTQSWYRFDFVANYISKAFNMFLCFGFPVIFTLVDKGEKSALRQATCGYLSLFTLGCLISYFTNK